MLEIGLGLCLGYDDVYKDINVLPYLTLAAKKYRQPEDALSLSLMSDPRVIRGTTNQTSTPTLKKLSTGRGNLTTGIPTGLASTDNRSSNQSKQSQSSYYFDSKKYCSDELDLSLYLTEGWG
jgi:hypothetical protein